MHPPLTGNGKEEEGRSISEEVEQGQASHSWQIGIESTPKLDYPDGIFFGSGREHLGEITATTRERLQPWLVAIACGGSSGPRVPHSEGYIEGGHQQYA